MGYHNRRGDVVTGRNLNASLFPGQLVALLGVNGAGKSTLLRTMAGFQKPLHGKICYGDSDLADFSDGDLSRLISVVLTERPSVSAMTVTDLVALGRSPYTGHSGRLSEGDMEIVRNAIAAVGMFDKCDRIVNTLSDGELQKCMIAKSIAQNTPAILLDEPAAFLDFPSKVELMRLLKDLALQNNKIIIFSSHDISLSLQMANIVWLLDSEGNLIQGTPAELAENCVIDKYFTLPGISFDKSTFSFRNEIN